MLWRLQSSEPEEPEDDEEPESDEDDKRRLRYASRLYEGHGGPNLYLNHRGGPSYARPSAPLHPPLKTRQGSKVAMTARRKWGPQPVSERSGFAAQCQNGPGGGT